MGCVMAFERKLRTRIYVDEDGSTVEVRNDSREWAAQPYREYTEAEINQAVCTIAGDFPESTGDPDVDAAILNIW